MDYTQYDINSIEWGDKWLTSYLKDPDGFVGSLKSSIPLRFCLSDIYSTLVRLGAAPGWKEQDESEMFLSAMNEAKKLWPEATENQNKSLAKCVFVLNHFAEKRLSTTTGE